MMPSFILEMTPSSPARELMSLILIYVGVYDGDDL